MWGHLSEQRPALESLLQPPRVSRVVPACVHLRGLTLFSRAPSAHHKPALAGGTLGSTLPGGTAAFRVHWTEAEGKGNQELRSLQWLFLYRSIPIRGNMLGPGSRSPQNPAFVSK